MVRSFLAKEQQLLDIQGGLVPVENFRSQSRRDLLSTCSVLARIILADTEEECIKILSEMAGFPVPVSIGSEFRTFEEVDPDTNIRRPVVSEWDGFRVQAIPQLLATGHPMPGSDQQQVSGFLA